jgi:predicted PurR-regulated permease PerM
LAGIATGTVGAFGTLLLVLFIGIFLAVDPALYRDGAIRLLPIAYRARAAEALRAASEGLSRWLLGQSISMLFVGSAVALGLWLLGIPLALAVGLLCGILAFVPFLGAIAGALFAVLLAFAEGPTAALHVLILFIGIQQIESHILMPLVQKWAVELPPALGLVSTVAFAIIFGLPAALLATPLMVVLMVIVRKVYIEDYLEHSEST